MGDDGVPDGLNGVMRPSVKSVVSCPAGGQNCG